MEPVAICNGCGNESPAWDQLCGNCSQQVICQHCGDKYKRGQGLQEVNICASCLQEVFARDDDDEEELFPTKRALPPRDLLEQDDPDYGFDYQWELFNDR